MLNPSIPALKMEGALPMRYPLFRFSISFAKQKGFPDVGDDVAKRLMFWSSLTIVVVVTSLKCYLVGIQLDTSNMFTFLATIQIIQEHSPMRDNTTQDSKIMCIEISEIEGRKIQQWRPVMKKGEAVIEGRRSQAEYLKAGEVE
ncbi:hypothetical protein L2E82_32385 [Cichorium intybus]|uniref:Uncharacterized protein n=1 Tax=Cichorium intybus TaxID=13427 RepID=A0ACB9BJ14_CICIN|nr:hypothetical protein L2E82_32385 [Cichorium intybus]